ncbi:GntR family transcriptional regulator [Granulosicoccus antarcticus]|uniref:GntR family transcriptional regulator n=1 Tax=Granulosicoccus antarcticus TaxID=437505 RepID=UPI00197B0124|nr:UTRA domain-containing protein [Granulosicoccus antarcticus]
MALVYAKNIRNILLDKSSINGWMDVQAEVLHRLHTRVWKPGELLPSEADLATEFGCARTTVNRALQAIAEEGLLERRRRGGTRVVIHPEHKASFNIPVIRQQVEQKGQSYDYQLISRRLARPGKAIKAKMCLLEDSKILCIRAVHMADKRPFVLENRWIDISVVPAAESADFTSQSANEWLVEHVPFSGGDLILEACHANDADAQVLECDAQTALFRAERTTRNTQGATITFVQLVYAPGYRMSIDL